MQVFEKPEVEFIEIGSQIITDSETVCSSVSCNLQGCPDDGCSGFAW